MRRGLEAEPQMAVIVAPMEASEIVVGTVLAQHAER